MKKFAKKTISHSGSVEAYCLGCTPCSCDAACTCTDAYMRSAYTVLFNDRAESVSFNQAWRNDSGK